MTLIEPDESRGLLAADDVELRRDFSTAERVALAKKGQAIPVRNAKGEIIDGRYPIVTAGDLSNAIQAIGRANGASEVKAFIVKRAKAVGRMDMIPDSWKGGMRAADDAVERRVVQLTEVELRDPPGDNGPDGHTGGDWYTVTGYAAVFNSETTLRDGRHVRLRERIEPGAFGAVLASRPDVHLLIGHDLNYPLARTGVRGPGALDLNQDDHGLRMHAKLNPRVSYARDLVEQMRAGVVDQMSFGFTVPPDGETFEHGELEDGRSDTLRTIRQIGRLFDVTITPAGAYPDTSVAVRSAAAYLGRDAAELFGDASGLTAIAPASDLVGGSVIAPDGGDAQRALVARKKAHARARLAAMRYPTR